jgi:hypothetical protein
MVDVSESEEPKVLFVRISSSTHNLLTLIAAHEAATSSQKLSLKRTVEQLIVEGALSRKISIPT